MTKHRTRKPETWQAAVLLPRGDEQCWMSLEQMAEVSPASERQGWPEVMAGRWRRVVVKTKPLERPDPERHGLQEANGKQRRAEVMRRKVERRW